MRKSIGDMITAMGTEAEIRDVESQTQARNLTLPLIPEKIMAEIRAFDAASGFDRARTKETLDLLQSKLDEAYDQRLISKVTYDTASEELKNRVDIEVFGQKRKIGLTELLKILATRDATEQAAEDRAEQRRIAERASRQRIRLAEERMDASSRDRFNREIADSERIHDMINRREGPAGTITVDNVGPFIERFNRQSNQPFALVKDRRSRFNPSGWRQVARRVRLPEITLPNGKKTQLIARDVASMMSEMMMSGEGSWIDIEDFLRNYLFPTYRVDFERSFID